MIPLCTCCGLGLQLRLLVVQLRLLYGGMTVAVSIAVSHVIKPSYHHGTSGETLEAGLLYNDSQGLEHLCLAEPASCPYFSGQSSVIAVNHAVLFICQQLDGKYQNIWGGDLSIQPNQYV